MTVSTAPRSGLSTNGKSYADQLNEEHGQYLRNLFAASGVDLSLEAKTRVYQVAMGLTYRGTADKGTNINQSYVFQAFAGHVRALLIGLRK